MAQFDLFARGQLLPPVPQKPDVDKIRMLLDAAIRELRAADEMPWDSARLKSWHHVFQNMTKWLPAEERDELRRRFAAEISRLEKDLAIFRKNGR
jgi:hypothetical protein